MVSVSSVNVAFAGDLLFSNFHFYLQILTAGRLWGKMINDYIRVVFFIAVVNHAWMINFHGHIHTSSNPAIILLITL